MLRAFGRALLVTLILVLIGAALWYHPVITIIIILVGWLTFMFYTDPPEHWD
jgi:protein-S-isoprenylcysteine O-methyltransferase Ste14